MDYDRAPFYQGNYCLVRFSLLADAAMSTTTTSTILTSPYHFYNLRRNPFGELSRQERSEVAVIDLDRWRELLQDERNVIQFIGPCGHGKTTHLLAIERELPDSKFVYLPEFGPLPAIDDHRPMLIDEAQRLPSRQLRRVLSVGGPLILSTHVDLTVAIRRARLEVLTIEVAAGCTPRRLADILNRRIAASRLRAGPVPYIDEQIVISLQRRFGANIRAIEHFLYEQFQNCAKEQLTWPPAT